MSVSSTGVQDKRAKNGSFNPRGEIERTSAFAARGVIVQSSLCHREKNATMCCNHYESATAWVANVKNGIGDCSDNGTFRVTRLQCFPKSGIITRREWSSGRLGAIFNSAAYSRPERCNMWKQCNLSGACFPPRFKRVRNSGELLLKIQESRLQLAIKYRIQAHIKRRERGLDSFTGGMCYKTWYLPDMQTQF